MTSDEIRKLERDRYGYEDGTKAALFEIAAQLAELNQRLEHSLVTREQEILRSSV